MPSGEFEELEERAARVKQEAAEDLLIMLFGPYAGICEGILVEITDQLERENYRVNICKQHNDPSFPPDCTKDEKQLLRSKKCLRDANAAIFIFFKPISGRFPNWDPKPSELNASVVRELSYWIDSLDKSPSRTLALFEGDLRETYGSLIPGTIDGFECHNDDFPENDYETLFDTIVAQCWKWVA